MSELLISVIIPVYNVEKYLRKCLESVFQQTYKEIDIIIIDDGSTDRSGYICDEYKKKYPQITVVHKKNGGLSDARNLGIKMAMGDYVAFLDSDDFLSPYYFEIMAKIIYDAEINLVALKQPCSFWDEDEDAVELAKNGNDYKVEIMSNIEALERMFYLKIVTGAQFKICKTEIFKKISFPQNLLYEDLATTYKEFMNVDRVAIVDSKIYAYRKRMDGIIRQKFSEKKLGIIEVSQNVVYTIDNVFPELLPAAKYRVFSPLFSVFLQVPFEEKLYRTKLWSEIVKYRKSVIKEKNQIRAKDRIAAFLTYLGKDITYYIGKKFGQKGTMYK